MLYGDNVFSTLISPIKYWTLAGILNWKNEIAKIGKLPGGHLKMPSTEFLKGNKILGTISEKV